ncbi:MAG: hypothetical protein ACXW4B_10610 [Micavibrio sp.]
MFKLRDFFNDMALSNEAQARRLCERLCTALPDLPRLKTIASVGAYDAEIGADMVDSKRLTGVMSYLLRSGFLIDPDFTLDAINFRQRRDFLLEENKADLVFVSFILERHQYGTLVYDESLSDAADKVQNDRAYYGLALSQKHRGDAWKNRLEASGAQVVVTYGGADEIGTQTFCNDDKDAFTPVIRTPRHRICNVIRRDGGPRDLEKGVNLKTLYNDAANDLPMPWLGFAARPGYLKDAAPGLSAETLLGRRALALLR